MYLWARIKNLKNKNKMYSKFLVFIFNIIYLYLKIFMVMTLFNNQLVNS